MDFSVGLVGTIDGDACKQRRVRIWRVTVDLKVTGPLIFMEVVHLSTCAKSEKASLSCDLQSEEEAASVCLHASIFREQDAAV